ncbi:efflux RND transporter permease subunit [Puteibacter caeruleilacunae]|nr:efflux RND transporter permease subunit [Puteibacter caeruleilacunae]
MRKLLEKFVQFPFYANILIVVVFVGGFIGLSNMKRSFFPELESKTISVAVYYPGASPVEMEEGITTRIEEAVRGIIGIKEINSTSSENNSVVEILTTGEYNIDQTLMEVKNAVDGISALPSAAERPIVEKVQSSSRVLNLALAGETKEVDYLMLNEYANEVEEDLLASGIISQVTIAHAPTPEIAVEIDEDELLRYHLTFDEIRKAIINNNRDLSAGEIKSETSNILVRLRSRSVDVEKISNIKIRTLENGTSLKLRDIANIARKSTEDFYGSFNNGRESLVIKVEKIYTEDIEDISNFCKQYTHAFNKNHNDVELGLFNNRTSMLEKRLKLLSDNGLMGLVLVVVMLSLFLSMRLSGWVAFGIPFSFLALFIAGNLMGLTINMMSLYGMIVVIGILVDDGIVIAENIFSHFESGKSNIQAAIDGTMEVMPAVLTSVSTTMVAFTPLLFFTGSMEDQYDVGVVVILALAFSLIESFLVLPSHIGSKHVLNAKTLQTKESGLRRILERCIVFLRDQLYGPLIDWLLRYRYPVIAFGVLLVMVTVGLLKGEIIKTTYFPTVDYDEFEINIAFTPGDGEKQTFQYLHQFEQKVWEVNEELKTKYNDSIDIIENVMLAVGKGFGKREKGPHTGRLVVFPRDLDDLEITGMEIANLVKKKIGKVPEAKKFAIGGKHKYGVPVAYSLMSRNMLELEHAKDYMLQEMNKIPTIRDVQEANAMGKQEILLDLKAKAYALGFDEYTLAQQVRTAFYGTQVQRLQDGRNELRMWIRYPQEARSSMDALDRMKIMTSKGEAYPLHELAAYNIERGPVAIKRYNGKREARIEADMVDPFGSVSNVIAQIDEQIIPVIKAKYPGVSIKHQGQQKSSKETTDEVEHYYLIAFAFIVLILMVHFKSLSQGIIILLMIPLSMVGVIWGHGIHGYPVSLMSLMGIIALSGVIINDAVVFLSRFNSLIIQGTAFKDAIIIAGKSRLRAILLTTLTTTIGLFPMILETNPQAQLLIPMAISLAYGVAIGTIFILIFFPVLIHINSDMKVYLNYLWTGKKATREELSSAKINQDKTKES